MVDTTSSDPETGEVSTDGFSKDTTLEVLRNRRRRYAIHYLKRQGKGETVTLSELTERIAAWEYGKPADELTNIERKRVRNALRQFHLPKLAEYGFIEFDARRGEVILSDAAYKKDFFIESVTGGTMPWALFYLGLSGVSCMCLVALWADIPPFDRMTPLMYGVLFVTALTILSVGYFYDNYYRMRLGARKTPGDTTEP